MGIGSLMKQNSKLRIFSHHKPIIGKCVRVTMMKFISKHYSTRQPELNLELKQSFTLNAPRASPSSEIIANSGLNLFDAPLFSPGDTARFSFRANFFCGFVGAGFYFGSSGYPL